jgi:hypothetical protein
MYLKTMLAAASASIIMMAAAVPAFADDSTSTANSGSTSVAKTASTSNANSDLSNQNTSNLANTQGQGQGQKQGQTQGQTQAATSNNRVSTTTVTSPSQTSSSDLSVNENTTNKQPLQAPALFVTPSNSTAPCYVAVGAGVSFAGGGIGASGGKKDKGCEMRARVELLKSLGKINVALVYLCNSDLAIRQAFVDDGLSCYPSPDTLKPSAQAVHTEVHSEKAKEGS